MTATPRPRRPAHVRLGHVEWVEQRLSERDWKILATVNQLKLVTTHHLDRLHFADLDGRSQVVTRGRAIRRLINWRVVVALPRRVGGAAHGSAATVLALDSAGRRLLALRQAGDTSRLRYPGVPGERTVRHTLAVAELYTFIVEASRSTSNSTVTRFAAEPESWWPNGLGGYLKPDAYLLLTTGGRRYHWWIEVDLATESLPTLRKKALAYLDFWRQGQLGPGNVMPRVVFSVPTEQRQQALRHVIASLPEPATELFLVAADKTTALALLNTHSGR